MSRKALGFCNEFDPDHDTMRRATTPETAEISPFPNGTHSTQFPCPLGLAAGNSVERTGKIGEAIGKELVARGINWILAPVIDLITDSAEPSEVPLRFGDNPDSVNAHAVAFIQGLRRAGVVTCVTQVLAALLQEVYRRFLEDTAWNGDLDELIEDELRPLRHLLEHGTLDCLMLSSCTSDFDDIARSRKSIKFVIDEVVRRRINFRGPAIVELTGTDSCANHAPLRALLAGSDMAFLSPNSDIRRASVNAVYAAIIDIPGFETALFTASERIEVMKAGVMAGLNIESPASPELLSSLVAANRPLVQAAFRASIITLQASPSPLVSLLADSIVLLLTPTVPPVSTRNVQSDPFEPLGRALSRSQPRIRHVPYTMSTDLSATHMAFLNRAGAVILVLACTTSALVDAQQEIWSDIEATLAETETGRHKTARIVVSAGDVRHLYQGGMMGRDWWGVACWDYSKGALEAAAEIVSGQRRGDGGMLPLTIR
ncbi:hypothetical protein MMC13_001442 [Lambiella insularis]|nr:hypothetical protein [Lambiella insularis]